MPRIPWSAMLVFLLNIAGGFPIHARPVEPAAYSRRGAEKGAAGHATMRIGDALDPNTLRRAVAPLHCPRRLHAR